MTSAGASDRPASLGRLFSLGLAVSLATAIVAVVRGKVAALVLGPEGVGITAEITNAVSTGLTLATAAAGPALVRAVARGSRPDAPTDDRDGAQSAYDTVWTATAVLAVFGVVVAALVAPFAFPWGSGGQGWVVVMGAALSVNALSNVTARSLSAGGFSRQFSIATVAAVVLQVACVVAGTLFYGLDGFLAGNLVGALLAAASWIAVSARTQTVIRTVPRVRVHREHLMDAARLGLASLAGSGSTQVTLLVLRSAIARDLGSAANGFFQACWSIDGVLIAAVLSTMTNFIGPRYAAARGATELRTELNAAGGFVLRAGPPILLTAIALRGPVLIALYSAEFRPAVELLGWMLAGDVAKNVSWAQGYALIYRGHARIFAAVQLVGSLLFCGLAVTGLERFGLIGIGYAWFATYILNIGLTAFAIRRAEGIALAPRTLILGVLGAVLAVVGNAAVGAAPWGAAVPLAFAVAWALLAGLPRAVRSVGWPGT